MARDAAGMSGAVMLGEVGTLHKVWVVVCVDGEKVGPWWGSVEGWREWR